jgi:hypothetical protein
MTTRRLVAISVVLALLAGFRLVDRADASNGAPNSIPPASSIACAAQQQQAAHHAGLVIVFPNARIESRCIAFSGDTITGAELLRESGLPIVFANFGGALGAGVCRIDDVGCRDPGNCFCQCQGADCAFWSYFKLDGTVWRYENLGPANHRLHDGDTDAWVWGSGHAGPGDAPPPCPQSKPSPTPAPPPNTQPPARDGSSGAPGSDATRAPAVVGESTPVSTTASTQAPVATTTPAAQLRAAQTASAPNAQGLSKEGSTNGPGSGVPGGLIAFGAVAGVLAAGIGIVVVRRRIGG